MKRLAGGHRGAGWGLEVGGLRGPAHWTAAGKDASQTNSVESQPRPPPDGSSTRRSGISAPPISPALLPSSKRFLFGWSGCDGDNSGGLQLGGVGGGRWLLFMEMRYVLKKK